MIRLGFISLGVWLTTVGLSPAIGEVLQNISDDSVNVSIQPAPSDQAEERRFNYRVICSPTDETLPDCVSATENAKSDEGKPSMALPVPDFPAEANDIDIDQLEAANTKIAKPAKPIKKASKKQQAKAVKNSSKKRGKNNK